MTVVNQSFSIIDMANDNNLYFTYEGYESRFGRSRRPALVRFSRRVVRGVRYGEEEELHVRTLFIDGKAIEDYLSVDYDSNRKNYELVIVSPVQINKNNPAASDMVARPFNPNSKEDWNCLFYDTSEFNRMGDRLAYAIIAIALDRYSFSSQVISAALKMLQEFTRVQVIDLIKYASFGLSSTKVNQVNELVASFGRPADCFFPPILAEAAKLYGINYSALNVHSLVDQLFEIAEEKDIINPTGFARFIKWLNDSTLSISLQELDTCFAFLGEEKRSLAIRRFFLDVKNGSLHYDPQSLKAFSSTNYQYYSTQRYIFECWPGNRNVSTEFLLDCLKTYEQTNQERFQISDGILDWAIQKSIEVNRPIEMNFHDWLCYCQGGILLNKSFRGFANFEIQYELDDFAFEDESLKKNIHSLVWQHCTRLSHEEEVPRIDPITGLQVFDKKTQKPLTIKKTVYDNRWRPNNEGAKRVVNLFVNWEKKPAEEKESDVFTLEMVDYSIVRNRVEKYLTDKYGTVTPYISERHSDDIVKMFSYEIGMKVNLDNEVTLGENPGVDESVVKQRIRERMIELFGETLECEYNPEKYRAALKDSLFRLTGKSKQCFERREKMYRWERRIYCAPEITDLPNLLTGRKCADCQRDMCFVTCIKKDPDWKEYALIHILEIIGYHVLEETEAGLIPNPVYNQFVNQINKAVRFSKRLVCKDCGHILFPAQKQGHSKFKCLLLSCPEYNKEVYLNYCHDCKKGIIDSRDTKQCPNGMYICPSCGSCCSNNYFEFMADKYRVLGKKIPLFISRNIGNGHRDRNMFFCHKCGAQKVDVVDKSGNHEWRCLACDPLKDEDAAYYEVKEDYPPIGEEDMIQEPWA